VARITGFPRYAAPPASPPGRGAAQQARRRGWPRGARREAEYKPGLGNRCHRGQPPARCSTLASAQHAAAASPLIGASHPGGDEQGQRTRFGNVVHQRCVRPPWRPPRRTAKRAGPSRRNGTNEGVPHRGGSAARRPSTSSSGSSPETHQQVGRDPGCGRKNADRLIPTRLRTQPSAPIPLPGIQRPPGPRRPATRPWMPMAVAAGLVAGR